jgi:hypothetical protein
MTDRGFGPLRVPGDSNEVRLFVIGPPRSQGPRSFDERGGHTGSLGQLGRVTRSHCARTICPSLS